MSRWWTLLLIVACGAAGEIPAGMTEQRLPGLRLYSAVEAAATRALAEELQRFLPALSAWAARAIAPLPRAAADLPVLFFADRSSFRAYAARHAQRVATVHAAGFYSSDGRPETAFIALYRDGGREQATVRHELTHWLLDRAIPTRPGQPVWYNEGLAVCMEDAWISDGALVFSRVPRQRQEVLRRLVAGAEEPLATVVALGSEAWLARAVDHERAHLQYTASYGAVLFLLQRHPERLTAFLRRLAQGAAHDAAYAEAFAELPGGLDRAWRAWMAETVWLAARGTTPRTAPEAFEHGLAWLPEHAAGGDRQRAWSWLQRAAEQFAARASDARAAADAWLAAAEACEQPPRAAQAAETAAAWYEQVAHEAGQAEAWRLACRAWGKAGDWQRAALAGGRAQAMAERVADEALLAAALAAHAACYAADRARPPAGQTPQAFAAPLFHRAIQLYRQAGCASDAARVAVQAAQALAPPDGQPGDWAGCIALVEQAVQHWRRDGAASEGDADLATAERVLAGLWRPDRNPAGSWTEAIAGYRRALALLDDGEARERLHARLELASCLAAAADPETIAQYRRAESEALALGDLALAAYAAYQVGWELREREPEEAVAAFLRAAPRYRRAGKLAEEIAAIGQAAQVLAGSGGDPARIAELHRQAAALARARGDLSRLGYHLHQQAWFSEPARQPGLSPAIAAGLYAAAAQAWQNDPERAVRALSQRARVLTPQPGAAEGWEEAAAAWQAVAEALAALPESRQRRGERGQALHQQAWCLIRGDHQRHTRLSRALFSEAARLQEEAGDSRGAAASRSWLRE
ncbi:MAG: DUF1570 domain-containing protein [Planctomycetes bacterium]|nr:DUF1570 domain-containing protein [Planctomycetota bacterium]